MKNIWLFIILALFIQEPATTDAAIFQVRHFGFSLLLVNLIWALATAIDIWLGYRIGKWIQKKFQGTKFETFSKKWAAKVEHFIGRKGERFVLVLLGVINFPYLNSFLASWLDIPFKNVLVLIFIGDSIYWAIEWAINIGVRGYFTDPHTALYAVIGLGLLFSIFSKMVLNKVLRNKIQ